MYINPVTGEVLDILTDRRLPSLLRYFSSFSVRDREAVKFVVCDMYAPYVSLTKQIFPTAKIIIDRFHIIQNFTHAFNIFRVQVMKKYDTNSHEYKVLKRYRKLLLKSRYKLNFSEFWKSTHFKRFMSEMTVVDHILDFDEDLRYGYDFDTRCT